MASHWNGKNLQDTYTRDAGYTDSGAKARTLRYLNEIQKDICSDNEWPFLKFKLKKLVESGSQYVDISPQVPEAPFAQTGAGGNLSQGQACQFKVTFVLFDEANNEYSSIESEPSLASDAVTPTDENLKIQLTNIPSYDGDSDVSPYTVHRRIYMKQGDKPYLLVATIAENDSNTVSIEEDPSSTIEPPENSMVEHLSAEDLCIQVGTVILHEEKLDDLQKYDPGMTSVGTPRYYARISETKIMIYPRPSNDVTISYWVKRRPARIFADSDRAIQLNPSLETLLETGVNWKWLKYKQDSDWPSVYELYERLKSQAKATKARKGGRAMKVKVVC